MLKGKIPAFLDVNPVETSVMCRIHLWNLHYRIIFFPTKWLFLTTFQYDTNVTSADLLSFYWLNVSQFCN